jgi:hypothetical protein
MKMSLERIEFTLEKVGPTGIRFQVHRMDENFRNNKYSFGHHFKASNGVEVWSASNVQLWMKGYRVFLLGSNEPVDRWMSEESFATTDLRDIMYERIICAIRDWNDNWYGFQTSPCREVPLETQEEAKKETVVMPKIKFELQKIGDTKIRFKVLEMDERFRAAEGPDIKTHEFGYITVMSAAGPQIETSGSEIVRIFLRGDGKRFDNNDCFVDLPTRQLRDRAVKDIVDAIEDWAKNWEGWNSPTETFEF